LGDFSSYRLSFTNNAINYIYNEDNVNGEYTLSRINYTDNSVKLTYEDRDDVSTSYQAGSKLQQTIILFTALSLTVDAPCASILEVCVLPYSTVCPDLVFTVQ
jgi:hypothetical protein